MSVQAAEAAGAAVVRAVVNLKPASGYSNYSPAEHVLIAAMKKAIGRVYEANGFCNHEPCPVADRGNLVTKGGVDKQIYGIERINKGEDDDGQTRVGLPFDRTVPYAIWLAQRVHEVPFPHKRMDIGLSWRGEHAKPGRFRAFYQCDVDITGRKLALTNDVQCVMTMMEALDGIGISSYNMYINHIEFARALLAETGMSEEKIQKGLAIVDDLDKMPAEEIARQLVAHDDSVQADRVDRVLDLFKMKGRIQGFELQGEWSDRTRTALGIVQRLFQAFEDGGADMGRLGFCPGMTRGLDYYTGIVFETFLTGKEKFGSIASGGRYDNLVGAFNPSASDIEGVGGSIGLTRLFDVLVRNKVIEPKRTVTSDAIVLYRTTELNGEALKVHNMIKRLGLPVDIYSGNKDSIKDQLTYANRCGYPFVVSVMNADEVQVKDMAAQTMQTFTTLMDAAKFVKESYDPAKHGLINFKI